MFENALVESAGRLKTQSKFWTIATFALNAGVLAVMILLPLLHPEALPSTALASILVAPAPPPPAASVQVATAEPAAAQPSHTAVLTAPPRIPTGIVEDSGPPSTQPVGMMPSATGPGGVMSGESISTLLPTPVVSVARPATRIPVSTGVAAGNLIYETQPVYPAIARAAHIAGAVVLRAIISKTGTIEDLSVVSGSPMLRQAALDGVRNWRYKPFLLNGEPTDVDTTITINFTSSS